MSKKKWVGIFGGSFNPPHLGHLLAAVYALKINELDEVWFVPAYRHAFQKELLLFSDRVQMCKELIAGLGPRLKVSTIEGDLKSDGKMLKTLWALRRKNPSLIFSLVIGSDLLKETKRWYRYSEIENRFSVLVVPRDEKTKKEVSIPDISSTEIRRRIKLKLPLDNLLTPDVASFLESVRPPRSNRSTPRR